MWRYHKIVKRLVESKWTQAYLSITIAQVFVIVALQTIIAVQNTNEQSNIDPITFNAAHTRFLNIKWENMALIGFQLYLLGMVIDAIAYQNTAEVLVMAVLNLICAIFGSLEIMDGRKWLGILQASSINVAPLSIAEKVEIVLTIFLILFAIGHGVVSHKVSLTFGWNIYKKIGADMQIQRMYRLSQFFVLALKIDIFTQFIVSGFYLIQFVPTNLSSSSLWATIFHSIITFIMLPALYLARRVLQTEVEWQMIAFMAWQAIVVIHYGLVLGETSTSNNTWYFWIGIVALGIFVSVITAILAFGCMRNFGRGLQPYVQRGSSKRQADIEMDKDIMLDGDWRIDD
ncbi:hypothetical protein BZG36_03973 [Bifiguratus adelaidae]|uniref:Uncharacterized protein n=1 Tax=Bifiguratus adelaidae TaxID=1938954 RepID=A0A261XXG0_9FUNG|nr:hypothetical protein BZG36_03973 [Bifiguratus adelaidae]